jgi:hypothetical protein
MAAQKVGYTLRPIRYGSPNWQVSGSAASKSTFRAELETCQLGEPYLKSMQKPDHFGPQCPPSGTLH